MKIINITHTFEAFEQDYSARSGKKWEDKELELVFQAVKSSELSKEEVIEVAKSLIERDDFDRTTAGATFALNRMHVLVHGIAPEGETERRAEKMFAVPSSMIKFAKAKGYDTSENLKKAKAELKGRTAVVRLKEPEARQLMATYYKEHKDKLPKTIGQKRTEIIKDLMTGMSAEEAFKKHS